VQNNVKAHDDARLIERLLEHLMWNDVKYSKETENTRIEFGHIDYSGEELYFIRDNGRGFDMQYANKLFGALQRLHGDEYEGTGIGLATVQRIVERHRSKVWAEAEVNVGATIYFTLGV